MTRVAKFYKAVETDKEGSGFVVRLDGKPVKTPARSLLALPTLKLADGIAAEWRAQTDVLDPTTMPLTRFAYAAIDVAPTHRARLTDEILAYGKSDLLCYRADAPAALIARQNEAWNPLLDWAAERFGTRLRTGTGIAFVDQLAESQAAFAKVVQGRDDFALVGLHGAASLTGSLVLGLALTEGRLPASEAFALSCLDETFQAEAWGRDAEAAARTERLGAELAAIERFLTLSRP
jgi:chaperone required for assembly of F1-ATPase